MSGYLSVIRWLCACLRFHCDKLRSEISLFSADGGGENLDFTIIFIAVVDLE
jgi:hypothetical protein